ncbi:MAG: hypothetical protein ABI323_14385 [Solirubrobacteraceae bacterium]
MKPEVDREATWLDLLRSLTALSPAWMVWKNVDSALHGFGDVDSVAPRRDWPLLEREFRSWAFRHGLGPVIACPHAPNLLHLVALHRSEPFFELDLSARKVFLGSTLFVAEDLSRLAITDGRGFRRIRPGAEGLLKLVNNGGQRDGRPNLDGLKRKRIPELLSSDPSGTRAAAFLFGPARRSIVALASAVVGGGWNRRAMLSVEAWFLGRAVLEPTSVLARIRFRRNRAWCPVLRAVFAGRLVPGDSVEWLHAVERHHTVHHDPRAERGP